MTKASNIAKEKVEVSKYLRSGRRQDYTKMILALEEEEETRQK